MFLYSSQTLVHPCTTEPTTPILGFSKLTFCLWLFWDKNWTSVLEFSFLIKHVREVFRDFQFCDHDLEITTLVQISFFENDLLI